MPSVIPGRVHTTRLERRVHHEIACMNKTGVASDWLVTTALRKPWIMRLAFPLIAPPESYFDFPDFEVTPDFIWCSPDVAQQLGKKLGIR